MESRYSLEEYYIRYLKSIRQIADSSVKHYLDALKYISGWLKRKDLIRDHVFEIMDTEQLLELRAVLYSDTDFMALDKRGHQMYSSGLNNYCRFAEGVEFEAVKENAKLLDIVVPISDIRMAESRQRSRSTIIRNQVIEFAGHQCELNSNHKSFVAEKTHRQYMEGHHAIPMRKQGSFENSLDVYANIVCLCPLCHRKIHYGLADERVQMMNQIYFFRKDRLYNSGIKLSKEEFASMIS